MGVNRDRLLSANMSNSRKDVTSYPLQRTIDTVGHPVDTTSQNLHGGHMTYPASVLLQKKRCLPMLPKKPGTVAAKEEKSCIFHCDIVRELLLRLPAKSVGRFRCVSKSWLAITTDPFFLRAHTNLAPKYLFSQSLVSFLPDVMLDTKLISMRDGKLGVRPLTILDGAFCLASCDALEDGGAAAFPAGQLQNKPPPRRREHRHLEPAVALSGGLPPRSRDLAAPLPLPAPAEAVEAGLLQLAFVEGREKVGEHILGSDKEAIQLIVNVRFLQRFSRHMAEAEALLFLHQPPVIHAEGAVVSAISSVSLRMRFDI
ncbi:Putative F-box protein [Apostasia shenzhenica]|uniref:F-box protein n=1 Tax=Apostasia shenzhenica TaxID=1088818 RepID=A0A2I0B5C5_9ASPA|nr:Putative F-box protein [Apostasia shenzhenica]